MDPSYARRYRDLAARHWWWRARNDAVRREVSRLLAGRRDAGVLDIGCGDAVLFPFLSGFGYVEGLEPDPAVISPDSPWAARIARRPFDASFSPGRRFDLVLMLDVLEHFEDAGGTLRLVAPLLEPQGHVLVTVPAFRLLWTAHDELNRHFHRFTRRQLREVAGAAGLEVVESRYLFQWLFGAKLVERARERVLGAPPPEQVPPAPVNNALYWLCSAERRMAGRAMPFGSSLLAILRHPGRGAR